MKTIAIFASGSGSNALNIYECFTNDENVKVKYLVCNNSQAGVLSRFENKDVEIILINKSDLSTEVFLDLFTDIDLIVLAGFLLLIPLVMIHRYPNKIINIHPALLPKYGGKGMYGDNIHQSVLANNESEHGITIHFVNEEFDKGEIIFQNKFRLSSKESIESVKTKIQKLEHQYFPEIIKELLNKRVP